MLNNGITVPQTSFVEFKPCAVSRLISGMEKLVRLEGTPDQVPGFVLQDFRALSFAISEILERSDDEWVASIAAHFR